MGAANAHQPRFISEVEPLTPEPGFNCSGVGGKLAAYNAGVKVGAVVGEANQDLVLAVAR
jgi:hypothetical protein